MFIIKGCAIQRAFNSSVFCGGWILPPSGFSGLGSTLKQKLITGPLTKADTAAGIGEDSQGKALGILPTPSLHLLTRNGHTSAAPPVARNGSTDRGEATGGKGPAAAIQASPHRPASPPGPALRSDGRSGSQTPLRVWNDLRELFSTVPPAQHRLKTPGTGRPVSGDAGFHRRKLRTASSSRGCHKQVPQTYWLETTETYPVPALKARSPKSRPRPLPRLWERIPPYLF